MGSEQAIELHNELTNVINDALDILLDLEASNALLNCYLSVGFDPVTGEELEQLVKVYVEKHPIDEEKIALDIQDTLLLDFKRSNEFSEGI